jgi:CO/xanthine dehydrogenase FAD-binding subunit
MGLYLRPASLPEALAALADPRLTRTPGNSERLTVLAGGTDFFPALAARSAWLQPAPRNVLDISAIGELRGIRQDECGVTFGALATWSEIGAAALPPAFDGLKLAAREVGGRQVQNRGTIGGNLCNASPAADGVPPLLTLDASVEIVSQARGTRTLALAEFLRGNRKTALAEDELLVTIRVPSQPAGARATFLKLGARSYLVISIASVAVLLDVDAQGRVARAAIAVGACSAVPVRLGDLERAIAGVPCGEAVRHVTDALAGDALAPLDDVRGTARYRRTAAAVLVRRALVCCAGGMREAAA